MRVFALWQLEKLGLVEEAEDEEEEEIMGLELLEKEAIRSMIFKAVMQENVQLLDKLLHRGVDINVTNAGGYSPLGLASERGKKLACEWLLRHGAVAIP
jgi:hypothetical protein